VSLQTCCALINIKNMALAIMSLGVGEFKLRHLAALTALIYSLLHSLTAIRLKVYLSFALNIDEAYFYRQFSVQLNWFGYEMYSSSYLKCVLSRLFYLFSLR